ncbi:caspase domain-containing protein [Mycena galericulata]|nr:caspase domain-containing protein [Mycena galericulata]
MVAPPSTLVNGHSGTTSNVPPAPTPATDKGGLSPLMQPGTRCTGTAANVSPAPTSATYERDPVFSALVIGINNYKYIKPLNGCVADADNMVDYLTNTLGVSPSRITNLRNEQASRGAIKNSITALASDDSIRPGDPILIFFAGHGAKAKAPPRWTASDKTRIQMILPVDFKPETNRVEDWQGIPDITLAALLSNLAKAKGDNITVIHDCCYSGSSTRDNDEDASPEPDVRSRGIELTEYYEVLSSMDSETFDGSMRVCNISTGCQKTAMGSHVLLAACSESMESYESREPISGKICGNFTRELLSFLRNPTVQGATMTYTELIECLPDLPGAQYPQCDGDNRGRILFDGKAPKRCRMLYHVSEALGPPSIITLQAGEAQGITKNAVVSIFSSSGTTVPVGRLQVFNVYACSSILKRITGDPDFVIPSSACALLAKAGDGADISVAVPVEDLFRPLIMRIVREMESQRPEKRNIRVVARTDPHELALAFAAETGQVIFEVADRECVEAGLSRISHTVPLTDTDGLYAVLEHAADFCFHLRRSSHGSLARDLTLEAYTLEEKYLDNDSNAFSRDQVLMPSSENLCFGRVKGLHVLADDETNYGFKLVNHGSSNLYVWAFMFDVSTLSIRCIYRPPSAKMKVNASAADPADASVLAGGELTIGYGSGGARAQSFILEGDDMVDVSFLKLFVTNQYVDLSSLEQGSPFDGLAGRLNGCVSRDVMPVREVWDTVHLMIIQQRRLN